MDLAQYIADKMGLELEVVPMDFDGVLSELSQKNVDLGMQVFHRIRLVQMLWSFQICITRADSLS